MELKDRLDHLVLKAIRSRSSTEFAYFVYLYEQIVQKKKTMIDYSASFILPYMTCPQGSRGALGQEGVAGLDGEEVD